MPKELVKNRFKNFIKRCKKIIELKGGRLEQVHLNQIRKEEEEENKEKKEEESEEEEEEEELKLKIIFNEETLKKNAKKEISFLRKKIKAEKKIKENNIEIQNYKFKIAWIKKLIKENKNDDNDNEGIKKYFEYFKDTCDLKAQTRASTVDEKINEILKIKKSKLEKFEENFYNLEVNFKK